MERAYAFEPDISKIAESIGAARPAVMRGYNEYVGTKEKPVPSLSSVCKEKRDAAVLEQHKAGTSNKAIAKLFNLSGTTAVTRILEDMEGGSQKPDSGKCDPSVLPLANTEDRPDTRVDADPPPFENPEHRTEDATLLSQPLRVPWVCTSAVSDFIRCS